AVDQRSTAMQLSKQGTQSSAPPASVRVSPTAPPNESTLSSPRRTATPSARAGGGARSIDSVGIVPGTTRSVSGTGEGDAAVDGADSPPNTSALPSASATAKWRSRGARLNGPTSTKPPRAGKYSSGAASVALPSLPPTTKTLPSPKSVALW